MVFYVRICILLQIFLKTPIWINQHHLPCLVYKQSKFDLWWPEFFLFMITQCLEVILTRLSLDSTHGIWKYVLGRVGQCPNVIRLCGWIYYLLVVKTVSKWKRTFHPNSKFKKSMLFSMSLDLLFLHSRASFSEGPQTCLLF